MSTAALDEDNAGSGIGSFITTIPTVMWERRWWIIIPSILGLLAAIATALLIKPIYESSALMVVQSPQVQGQIFDDLSNEVVDRRIARIQEEVVSRPNLVALIERHRLYAADRQSQPLSEIVGTMRENIALVPTEAEVAGSSNSTKTIAYRLSYKYSQPGPTQAVTQDLMDKILELDATGNVEQATNTVQFLTDQAAELEQQIGLVQNQIAEVSIRNGGVLANGSASIIGSNSGSYDVQIASLQRDNATLTLQRRAVTSADQRDPGVLAAESALAAARASFTENHPDVVLARQRLAEARELARQNQSSLPSESIDQQIAFNNRQIAALQAAKQSEQSQINSRLAAQSRAPLVQQEITNLQQNLAGLNTQYQDVQSRLSAARAGVKAEDEQIAERLTLVEAPIVPDSPIWPNRLLIFALCVGGGLALGVVLALGVEFLNRPIRDPDTLARITGQKPMAVVPLLSKRGGQASGLRRLIPGLAGGRR